MTKCCKMTKALSLSSTADEGYTTIGVSLLRNEPIACYLTRYYAVLLEELVSTMEVVNSDR
ncbi:hypothetical protein BJ917_0306 [Pseudomonas sp. WPR_5_2]|nr:hypothetical protein BJ917_0306 [Pseudomonas sp. WPR_5_2]